MPSIYVKEVHNNLFLLRVDDHITKYFEGIWKIPEGITYNAYLLKTENGCVLFDGWKADFTEEFLNELSTITDLDNIKYVVINHAEPDHTGTLKSLLKETKYKPLVIGHPMTKSLIKALHGVEPKFRAVKDGEEMSVGEEILKFVYVPWLHWPETIVTYLEKTGVLISCDVFGGYSIPKEIFDEDPEVVRNYIPYVRKYMVNVIGHYRDFVIKGLNKLRDSGIQPKIIAPGHGLLWRKEINRIIREYSRWDIQESIKGKVTIVYTSMYGYVENAIKEAISELKKQGVNPVIHKFTDKYRSNVGDVLSDLDDSEAIIIGTATYEAGIYPIMKYILTLVKEKMKGNKPVMIITTYGWGDIAGRSLRTELEDLGFKVVSAVSIHGTLDQTSIEKIKGGISLLLKELSS